MAKQISVLADWATAATSYGNTVVKPSVAKRQAGWVGGATPDVPPAPHINWLHKTAYENVGWFVDNVAYGETAKFEYLGITANPAVALPIGATYRFGFTACAWSDDANFYSQHLSYNGASAFVAGGTHYNTSTGAATGFAFVSIDGGRSYQFREPAALTSALVWASFYDPINSRFVLGVSPTGAGSYTGVWKYTTDFGQTWNSTMFSPTATNTWYWGGFYQQAGRYVAIGTSNPKQWFYSASGSITGTYAPGVAMTSNDTLVGRGPVWNQRYIMWLMAPNSGTAIALYWLGVGEVNTATFAGRRTLLNGAAGVPSLPNNAGQGVFYFPHNDQFVIASTGSFLVLDGATGTPAGAGAWTTVVPSGGMPKGNQSFPTFNWMTYDEKRGLYYLFETVMWVAPGLAGPWKQLPAFNFSNGAGAFKVLSSSYLTEFFTTFNKLFINNTGTTSLDTALMTNAQRSFPPLF